MGSGRWDQTLSRQARGYGAAWDRLRKVILKRDGYLCQCPDCQGGIKRLTPASHVDHIQRKEDGGSDDPSNLRAVNAECHKRISEAQRGYKSMPKIGHDGFPIGAVGPSLDGGPSL